MNKKTLNEQGFTLVEILIGAALLGALSLGGMNLFKNQTKAQKTIERNYEMAQINQQIKSILSDPATCKASLGMNRTPGAALFDGDSSITKLVKFNPASATYIDVYAKNTLLEGNIQITNYQILRSVPGLAANETYLEVTYSRGKGVLTDAVKKYVKITATVAGAPATIQNCFAQLNANDNVWLYAPNAVDIFYGGDKVGIGTATPAAKLDVVGTIRPGSNGILIGEACSAEGALGYDINLHAMLFCSDSGVWASLGNKPPTRTILTSGAGTYNRPSGCKKIFIRGVAGGGGGGSGWYNAGGGGAGEAFEMTINNPTATYTYSVGAGGLGVSGESGLDGSSTTFHTLTVLPGLGGSKGTNSISYREGGAAGSSLLKVFSDPDITWIKFQGESGGIGVENTHSICGKGGNSIHGGSGNILVGALVSASGFGAGGAGGCVTTISPGTNGGSGLLIIDEYY